VQCKRNKIRLDVQDGVSGSPVLCVSPQRRGTTCVRTASAPALCGAVGADGAFPDPPAVTEHSQGPGACHGPNIELGK